MSEHTKGRLVPKFAGEFTSYQQWVNKGATWLKSPDHRRAMCIDALGRRVAIGADFMRARDEDAFPVRFFWECELTNDTAESELAAARAQNERLTAMVQEQDRMLGQKACATKECRELLAARSDLEKARKRDEEWHEHTTRKASELAEALVDRDTARALLREVSGDKPDFVPRVISQELADRIRSYLDACDTLEGAPNAG